MVRFTQIGIGVLLILCFVYAIRIKPDANVGYWIGMALGMLLTAATPSVFVALIHYQIVRKRANREERITDTLDNPKQYALRRVIRNYWFYVLFYSVIFGLLFSGIIIFRRIWVF